MALEVKILAVLDADNKGITITDVTGAYNVSSNPTGYGMPNKGTSDFDHLIIRVTTPNGDLIDVDKSVYATTVSISATDLEFDDELPDGIYEVQYMQFMDVNNGSSLSAENSGVNNVCVLTGVITQFTDLVEGFADTDVIEMDFSGTLEYFSIASIDSDLKMTMNESSDEASVGATNVNGITAGYKVTYRVLNTTEFDACFDSKAAELSIADLSTDQMVFTCNTFEGLTHKQRTLYLELMKDMMLAGFIANAQYAAGMYVKANETIKKALVICNKIEYLC